jgi:hypothetical protein
VLQQATKTPVRFVLFPGEPHGLHKYAHQKRKVEEDLVWFDTHLFGTKPEEPALQDGSPLEAALARKGFAQQGGLYGRTVKDKLVPEAVAFEGLQVARLEVTRAQYAAFDPKRRFPGGTGNLPASGVTFDEAKAYGARLASLTGEPWRLPSAADAKSLYAAGREGENTLDCWAGYTTRAEARGRRSTTSAATSPSGRWASTGWASWPEAAPICPRARPARRRARARPTAGSAW